MPQLIVTSCGISLLRNIIEPERRNWLWKVANLREHKLHPTDRRSLDQLLERARRALAEIGYNEARRLTAEVNGLLAFYRSGFPSTARGDMHFLLHTHTYVGERVATLLSNWLQSQDLAVSTVCLDSLTTSCLYDFQLGIAEMTRWVTETLPEYRRRGYRVIFNLVGGFKSIQAVLNTLGMFYADELIYIFESEDELIRIPHLPITLQAKEVISRHIQTFRRLKLNLPVTPEEIQRIPETLIIRIDDSGLLSAWGELLWDHHQHEIYSQTLLEPPFDRVVFGPGFRKSVENPTAQEKLWEINRTIDQLCQFMFRRHNPQSLDLKKIKGGPRGVSTHECDAWHDRDARRIFCHFERDNLLVLDEVAPALHG